jgi:DNA-binding helix-hairpin-helix protein with protein kinase domain
MNPLPTVVKDSRGGHIRLGRQIGRGGEGAVFETQNYGEVAVKLYWPNKAASRRDKIAAMVASAWSKSNSFVAYPIDALYTPAGAFAGFTMRRIGGHKPVHLLFSPSRRKLEFASANFRFLIRAAFNAATAVASVHANDCVIGDVNHSGFLVSQKAKIALIDSDSFQVIMAGKSFLCEVGTPEYTPPELQSSRFNHVKRTRNHDNFGLAVVIFQLLFMGRHPYSGRFQGRGHMPLERAIAEFRFAYSANKTTGMKPPPNAPVLSDFPDYIGEAFEKAFGPAGPQERPTGVKWIELLGRLEGSTQRCSKNPAHHHVQGKPCPWCKMEQASPGFVAFTSTSSNVRVLPITIDTGQVMALIASIKDPGVVPNIRSVLIVPTNVAAQGQLSFNATQLKTQHGLALGLSMLGVLIPQLGVPGLIAMLFSGAGAAISLYPDKRVKAIVEARREAEQEWHKTQEAWSRQPGNTNYLEVKSEAMSLVRDLNALPDEQKRELQRLEDNKRKAQLERYLERHPIKTARIRKIGSGRKAVLASFGIETAADVEPHRVAAVQGFGPFLVSELVAWRRGIEQRFAFNASEPIDPPQIAAVKTALVNKKVALETRLRSAVTRLQQVASLAVDQRNSLIASANEAFVKLNQAQSYERGTYPIFMWVAKIASVSCLTIMLLNLASPQKPLANLPQVQPYARAPASPPPAAPGPPARQQPPMNGPPFPTTPPFQERPSNDPSIKQPEPLPDGPASDSGDAPKEASKSPRVPTPDNDPALPPSKESIDNPAPLAPPIPIPPQRPRITLPAEPTPLFVGNWRPEAGSCASDSEGPPLRITSARAEAAGGRCEFDDVRRESEGVWRVHAKCVVNGETWQANIQFRATGERLIWTSERGRAQYFRCR